MKEQLEKIYSDAVTLIEDDESFKTKKVIVAASENWHHGVIGIVASRITEKYGKPCVLIAVEGNEAKGSCRGLLGFNMFEALSYCDDLLLKFGGHELAAGLTVSKDNIDAFREKINLYAKENFNTKVYVEEITYEGKITDKDINLELTDMLEGIQSCGMGNPMPHFLIEKVKIEDITYFGDEKHIRMKFSKKSFSIMVIGFGLGSNESFRMLRNGDVVNAIVSPYTNEYRNKKYPALKLKDINRV